MINENTALTDYATKNVKPIDNNIIKRHRLRPSFLYSYAVEDINI